MNTETPTLRTIYDATITFEEVPFSFQISAFQESVTITGGNIVSGFENQTEEDAENQRCEDMQDFAIAQQRLDEIEADPTRLITGEELEKQLARSLSNSAMAPLLGFAFSDAARDSLSDIPPKFRAQIVKKAKALQLNPHPQGSEPLKGMKTRGGENDSRRAVGGLSNSHVVRDNPEQAIILDVGIRGTILRRCVYQ